MIEAAGFNLQGKTLITTLEPCMWRKSGMTCSDRIIDSGLSIVVYGCSDVGQVHSSKDYLEKNGVKVVCLEEEYGRRISRYTHAHKEKLAIKYSTRAKEQEKEIERRKKRQELKEQGKLGYNRSKEKKTFQKQLSRFI